MQYHDFNGNKISTLGFGVMRLPNGTIAGSASSMLRGVRNLYSAGVPITDIARMAAYNPARTLKIDHVTGSIAVGKAADLAILDHDCNVLYTFVDGTCVYRNKGE